MELIRFTLLQIFELVILKPFYVVLELYIRADKYQYSDLLRGQSLSEEKLDQIRAFRHNLYQEKQAYLIPKNEIEIEAEKKMDGRSYHAVVYDKHEKIVAVARFTPYPFEVTEILGEEKTLPFSNYLEISRLICGPKKQGIGKRLLIKAGIFAIRSKKFDGFIAICRDENCTIFQKFGLKKIYDYLYEERGSVKYNFICADFLKVSTSTLMHFKTKLVYAFTTLG